MLCFLFPADCVFMNLFCSARNFFVWHVGISLFSRKERVALVCVSLHPLSNRWSLTERLLLRAVGWRETTCDYPAFPTGLRLAFRPLNQPLHLIGTSECPQLGAHPIVCVEPRRYEMSLRWCHCLWSEPGNRFPQCFHRCRTSSCSAWLPKLIFCLRSRGILNQINRA